MRRRVLTATVAAVTLAATLTQLPASAAGRPHRDDPVVTALTELTRGTQWRHVETIDLPFDIEHPQGMVRLGGRFFVSSVEIVEPTQPCPVPCDGYDRTPGRGVGHLFVIGPDGDLLADVELGEGDMYHPGGIDFDGRWLWVPVAEYRPDSNSVLYRVDPDRLTVHEEFRVADHIGGVVRDRVDGHVHGVSWGSRRFYEWTTRGRQLTRTANPSHFIDYQDCDYLAYRKMVCGGVASLATPAGPSIELGGLALLDLRDGRTVHEVPVAHYSPTSSHAVTRNPVFLERAGDGLRLYAAPDDGEDGAILVYETGS